MKGRIVLLTGATAGIGREAARQLADKGATLVCVARSEDKARALVDELRGATGNDAISYLIGDLSRPAEVRRVALALKEQHDRLDVLFNNAGAMFDRRQLTEDDLERTFALNHLGYFVMTVMLLDELKAAKGRVVSTSSGAHGQGDMAYLDDLQTEGYGMSGMKAYGRSKLANIWFTRELAERLEGTGVTATCFHPGFVASGFGYPGSRHRRVARHLRGGRRRDRQLLVSAQAPPRHPRGPRRPSTRAPVGRERGDRGAAAGRRLGVSVTALTKPAACHIMSPRVRARLQAWLC